MTLQQYKRLKKLMDTIEDKALEDGIDITSPDFQLVNKKILSDRGFTLEEYQKHEEDEEEEFTDEEVVIKTGVSSIKMASSKKIERQAEERRKEFGETMVKTKQELSEAITNLTNNLSQKSESQKKELLIQLKQLENKLQENTSLLEQKREEVEINLSKELEKAKKHQWTEHPQFIKDLNRFEDEGREIKKTLSGLTERVEKIQEEERKKQQEIEEDLNLIGETIIKLYE